MTYLLAILDLIFRREHPTVSERRKCKAVRVTVKRVCGDCNGRNEKGD